MIDNNSLTNVELFLNSYLRDLRSELTRCQIVGATSGTIASDDLDYTFTFTSTSAIEAEITRANDVYDNAIIAGDKPAATKRAYIERLITSMIENGKFANIAEGGESGYTRRSIDELRKLSNSYKLEAELEARLENPSLGLIVGGYNGRW